MAKAPKKVEDQRSEKATAERRDTILKTMLKTPPKPHKSASSSAKGKK
jgi:hypothetical protein